LETSDLHRELLQAIWEPDTREEVAALLNHSLVAVTDLSSMDQAIYEHFRRSGSGNLVKDKNAELVLKALKEGTLGGIRGLDDYLDFKGYLAPISGDDSDGDMDFDFGDFGAPAAPAQSDVKIDDEAIDDALDSLAPETVKSNPEKWRALKVELSSLAYGLHAQLRDFEARFDMALSGAHYGQAMRELDDTRNSLTDGIFALLATVCEAYLGEVDRAQLLPGHRSTLQKALLVRRGLAELRRSVNARNYLIQDNDADLTQRQRALERLVGVLADFLETDVFGAMRPADRFELLKFHDDLQGQTVKAVRLVCEGLDKYLDSLAVVNQRDVLIQHDREVMKDISDLLEAARPLLEISPRAAVDLVRQSFALANELFGWREPLDALLISWRLDPPDLDNPDDVVHIAQRLDELVDRPT
jgi:hypothetical protein